MISDRGARTEGRLTGKLRGWNSVLSYQPDADSFPRTLLQLRAFRLKCVSESLSGSRGEKEKGRVQEKRRGMKLCINLFSCFLMKSTFTPVVGPCGQPASAPQAPGASHGDKGGTTRRQEKKN